MALISKVGLDELTDFNLIIQSLMKEKFHSLEEAAQKFTDIIYEYFKDSIVLVRIFATLPFMDLPYANKEFVIKSAEAKGVSSLISDRTLVLSLLGTRGEVVLWNNRHKSKEHVGIPLVSADFIELIPMMSRLLKSLGLSLDWISASDTKIVAKIIGNISGLFYVPEAKTATDEQGRKIIAAQDFVWEFDVKTVFGFGSSYQTDLTEIMNIMFIFFTRENLKMEEMEQFTDLANRLVTATREYSFSPLLNFSRGLFFFT